MIAIGLLFGDNGLNLNNIIIGALFYGIFLSLTLVSTHKNKLKEMGIEKLTDQNLGVKHTIDIKSELNKSELIEKLKKDRVVEKMKMLEIENGVLFNKGTFWKYWGNEIKITLQKKGEKEFNYTISSRPISKVKIIDNGKNLKNVNRIKNLIQDIA